MKHLIRFSAPLAALALCLVCFSCEKEHVDPIIPPEPEPVDVRTPYLGTFDVTYVYDSVSVDGTWFENGFGRYYDPEYGFVVVTADPTDSNQVKFDGYTIYENENGGQDTHLFYNTTAAFDDMGRLVPVASSFNISGSIMNVQYGPLCVSGDTLTYKMEEHTILYGMDCGYIYTVTGIRRK